jgi:hypothetical protein
LYNTTFSLPICLAEPAAYSAAFRDVAEKSTGISRFSIAWLEYTIEKKIFLLMNCENRNFTMKGYFSGMTLEANKLEKRTMIFRDDYDQVGSVFALTKIFNPSVK